MNNIDEEKKNIPSLSFIRENFIVEANDDSESNEEGKNNDKDSAEKKKSKVLEFLKNAISSGSDSAIASLLDNFTLGNFKEAIYQIYKDDKLKNASEEDLKKAETALHEVPSYEKSKKQYKGVDSRKDDNTSTEIDPVTTQYKVMWFSEKDEQNLIKQLQKLTVEIQKTAKKQEDSIKETSAKIKSMKIEGIGDKELEAYGPIISEMLKDGKSADDIKNKIDELKKSVNESYRGSISKYIKNQMLTEGNISITEKIKNDLILESICNTDEYLESIARMLYENDLIDIDGNLLIEGFLDKAKEKIGKAKDAIKKGASALGKGIKDTSKAAWNALPDKVKAKIKDASAKALKFIKDGGLAPICKIAGISLLVISGAWGIALVVAVAMLIEKHGKQLKAAMEYAWTSFANSKGIITAMKFGIKDKSDLRYQAAFYVKDKVWRVVNLTNQLKHPNKDFAKAILTSDIGKKYIDRVIEIWDPVFSKEKGGKVDFGTLLQQSKNIQFSEKQINALEEFRKQYDEIKSGMQQPAIDTRTQSLKK